MSRPAASPLANPGPVSARNRLWPSAAMKPTGSPDSPLRRIARFGNDAGSGGGCTAALAGAAELDGADSDAEAEAEAEAEAPLSSSLAFAISQPMPIAARIA